MQGRRVIAMAVVAVAAVLWGPAAQSAVTCPCTIFAPSATPDHPAVTDGTAIEIGVKFRADTNGLVTGLRFYKGSANVGTHIGHLWGPNGEKLAEATFSGESASGWQQVQLAQPVAVTANTTYTASYWSASGYFADTNDYFVTAVDNPPLHAPSAGNGVYRYGTGFPTSTWHASNYWVDVVFTSGPDTIAPGIAAVSPADGAVDVDVVSAVQVQFDEAIDASTITAANLFLRDAAGAPVAAAVQYSAATLTATLTPSAPLEHGKTYSATVRGGTGGVADTAGNPLVQTKTWSFTTASVAPPPPDQGSGGPILVVHASSDGFGAYLPEILRTEGLNEFTETDVSNLSAAKLADFQVVVLGRVPLTDADVSVLTTWVAAGGKLIALRPDARLAPLLGLAPVGGTLGDGYIRIDTRTAPGAGITATSLQYHGSADVYTAAAGTRTVATLYYTSTTATPYPAVTLRSVGTAGGEAAAFTYDLGRSVVYTHQGNPAWAGQERDGAIDQGNTTIRSDDLFFGGVLPDFVDLANVAVPQADEQQRLLANLVTDMESDRLPVPRLWYFPNGFKAAIVMTGDEHPNGEPGTTFAFDRFLSQSTPLCSVVDWGCIRATAYVDPTGYPTLSEETAKDFEDQGFEIALHLRIPGPNDCNDFSSYADVKNALDDQLEGWHSFSDIYGTLHPPTTIRTHCIVWSDWDSQVRADLSDGIRLNADYYYWPSSWVAGRPGMFTGAGIPMRFAARDGSVYDVYQATTQLPDETFDTPEAMEAAVEDLLDGATGPNGYYGAFTTNVHNDRADAEHRASADAIVRAAKAHGVPVISARQLLTWLDGRNASSFRDVAFVNGHLRFTMVVGSGARGLQAMLPVHGPSGDLQSVTRDGQTLSFTGRVVKGVDYAVVAASGGVYEAVYGAAGPDTTPPTISSVAAAPALGGTATITWRTDEEATSRVDYGTAAASLTQTASDDAKVTAHSVVLSGLTAGQTYYFRVRSVDAAGNSATSPATGAPLSFVVPAPPAPPSISNVAAAPVLGGTATITWQTDKDSTSRVDFGTTASSLTQSAHDDTKVKSHSIVLSGLAAGQTYYYRVTSADAAGTSATYPATGAPLSFVVPADTTPPAITAVAAAPALGGMATITWRTDEAATSRVDYGTSSGSLTQVATDAARVQDHSVVLSGLTAGQTYYYRVSSADAAGNAATSPTGAPLSFVVPVPSTTRTAVDSSIADFASGATGATTFVGATAGAADGEVQLAPRVGEEFAGTALPAAWSVTTNVTGGTATVTGGVVTVDGARVGTTATYPAGASLEFYGVFAAVPYQHVGFGTTFDSPPWAIFSTGPSGAALYARTWSATTRLETTISGVSPTQPHRYRIVWTATSVTYWVDGTQVASHAVAITMPMRPLVSDYALGGANPSVSWLRLAPYVATGTYLSRVVDGGAVVDWLTLDLVKTTPTGTQIQLETRSGSSATPDGSWSAWQPVGATIASPNARYLQYRATLTTTDVLVSPSLESATITYATP